MEMDMEKETEGYDEHELKCAADTLLKAEEIKADSKLMEAIKPLLDKKVQAVKKITSLKELRQVANKKVNELED